jgi:hypothetical protein
LISWNPLASSYCEECGECGTPSTPLHVSVEFSLKPKRKQESPLSDNQFRPNSLQSTQPGKQPRNAVEDASLFADSRTHLGSPQGSTIEHVTSRLLLIFFCCPIIKLRKRTSVIQINRVPIYINEESHRHSTFQTALLVRVNISSVLDFTRRVQSCLTLCKYNIYTIPKWVPGPQPMNYRPTPCQRNGTLSLVTCASSALAREPLACALLIR